MMFWIIIATIALLVVLTMIRAVWRGALGETEAAAFDLQIYRDQLKEVDRDLARGVISEEEAERVRLEVSRRILAADAQAAAASDGTHQPKRSPLIVGALGLLTVLGGSLWLYQDLGTPGYPDLPIAERLAMSQELRLNRLTQDEAEARMPAMPDPEVTEEFLTLMERLRETVASRPGDIQGLSLLARNEAAIGNMEAAIAAQLELIDVRGAAADAADHAYLAELLMGATGGYISQEAEAAIRTSLELDPQYPFARYYLAQYMMQVDRPDIAFRTYRSLLEDGPEDAPWIMPIREQIEDIAWMAGVDYELPPLGAPRPSAEDIAAAQNMSIEERTEMIRGMVENLTDRLLSEGGPPDDWARLIRALGVLDEKSRANDIWTEAKQVFADDASALRRLYTAAQDAEIAQ